MTLSTTDISAAVRDAIASHGAVRATGSGTWLFGGPIASHHERTTLVRPHSGVVDYTPGDLVITVHAGTTLQELAAITGEHGQMLAIAPYGAPQATIGAVVATATAAPLAYDDLAVRDLVLGVTLVTGTGEVVRAGGKVVKNVAGFDLVRLNVGAFGTIGVLTEVSVRLHAKPIMDHIMTGTLPESPEAWVPRLIANRAPLPMLVRLAPGEPARLFARCTGNAARAAALRGMVQSYGAQHTCTLGPADANTDSNTDTDAHSSAMLRAVDTAALVLRARCQPTRGAELIREAQRLLPAATLLFHPARGTVRIMVPHAARRPHEDMAAVVDLARAVNASIVLEQGAAPYHDAPALDTAIKRTFDPHGVFPNRTPAVAAMSHP
jgi:glycolate oxidase FAD binding subunit